MKAKKPAKPRHKPRQITPPVHKPKTTAPKTKKKAPTSIITSQNRKDRGKKPKEKGKKQKNLRIDEPFKNFRLLPSAYAKWKPLPKATEMFIGNVLDINITDIEVLASYWFCSIDSGLLLICQYHTIKTCNAGNIEETQQTLNALHASLMRAIRGMKVPKPAVTSYKELQKTTLSLDAQLVQNTEQIERLDCAIDEEQELTTALENEMDQLELALSQSQAPTPKKQKVHPTLQPSHLATLPVHDPWPDGVPTDLTTDMLTQLSSRVADISAFLQKHKR